MSSFFDSDNPMAYPDISEAFLSRVAKDKRVSEGELAALKLALQKIKSKEIAQRLNISEAATRKRLGEVYKKFDIKGSGPGKLTYLRRHLIEASKEPQQAITLSARALPNHAEETLQKETPQNPLPSLQASLPSQAGLAMSSATRYQWNNAPSINLFQGRDRPLQQLKQWLLSPTYETKLLAICGIGGIGKTYLARKLAEEIGEHFQQVIWMSLHPEQKLVDFLQVLWTAMSSQHSLKPPPSDPPLDESSASSIHPSSIYALIRRVSQELSTQRYLIVLDGFESIFRAYQKDHEVVDPVRNVPTFDASRRQQASSYKAGFEVYGDWLTFIQESSAQPLSQPPTTGRSCIILTSREKPKEMISLQSDHPHAKLYTLEGLLDAEGEKLLSRFHLQGTSVDYHKLVSLYYGHPMALRLAANTVKDIFSGKIKDFLEQEIFVFDDLRSVIKSQFKRIPPIEQEVMYWLAINNKPCTLEALQSDIVSVEHKRNLIHTLRSLQRRFLVEGKSSEVTLFHLHPIIKEYVLDRFIRAVFQDLIRGDLDLFNRHALMKADAEDDVRHFQHQNIVQPIVNRLKNHFKSFHRAEEYLGERLYKFRKEHYYRLGYTGGNFINLMVQLSQGHQLIKKDFSNMTIWQAYLQGVQLRDVSFKRADLDRSVFTATLSDVMAIAMSTFQNSSGVSSQALSVQPLLACGDANGLVHLWDTPAIGQVSSASESFNGCQTVGQKRAEWAAHSSWVRAVAFIPNSVRLVTGGDDNKLKLWQLPTTCQVVVIQPELVWQCAAHDWVHAVAVSPDGTLIASAGDDKVTLYCVRTGKVLRQFYDQEMAHPQPQSAESTGELVASVSPLVGSMKSSQRNRVRTLAFSPNGQWLASSGDDCVIRLWAMAPLSEGVTNPPSLIRKLSEHTALVHALCFTPDSQQLISGSEDKTIKVWAVETGRCQATLNRVSDSVRSLAISDDGQLLASGGDDRHVTLWDFKNLKYIRDISTRQSRIWSVAFQQQGRNLLLGAGGDKQQLILWQITPKLSDAEPLITRQGQENTPLSLANPSVRSLKTYRGYTNGIRTVAFLGAQRIISGGDSGDLVVWDMAGHQKATLSLHQGRIWSVAVDVQHARIASASDDHTIRLWDATTGQCLTTLTGHNNWVRAVAFNNRGSVLASSGDDCTIRIWNTASGACLKQLQQSTYWVRSIAFNPTNSRYLVSGGDDQIVKLWDRKEGRLHQSLAQHEQRICSVAYSPDGEMVVSGSDDTTVMLCDVESAAVIYRFTNADLGIKAVSFSPDGRYLAAGGDDQLVYVWDLRASDPGKDCLTLRPQDYTGIAGGIRSVGFSPDSRFVISGGLDEMIRVGDLTQMTDKQQQVMKPLIRRDRPYEKIEIEEVKGLSDLQVANLMTLGAVNRKTSLLI